MVNPTYIFKSITYIFIIVVCFNISSATIFLQENVKLYPLEIKNIEKGRIDVINMKDSISIKGFQFDDEFKFPAYLHPKIYINNNLVYKNEEETYVLKSKCYFIKINAETFLLLLSTFDPVEGNKWQVLTFLRNKLINEKLIPQGFVKETQNYINLGGTEKMEAYCTGCGKVYYNPAVIYKINSKGLQIDSVAIRDSAINKYGKFHGYEPSTKIILPSVSKLR